MSPAEARAFDVAAWPVDWGDDTPAGETPVESATVVQMLPAVRRAATWMIRGLAVLILMVLFARWLIA